MMTNKMMNMVKNAVKVTAPVVKKAGTRLTNIAKDEFNKRYQVNEDRVIDMLNNELGNHDWYGYKVSIEFVPDDFTASHANCGANPLGGIAGITKPDTKQVTFYVTNLKRVMNTLFFLSWKKMIGNVVRHENRHVQQFTWLKDHGGEAAVERAMFNEAFSIYGLSPLERDAVDYQGGKENDLDKVCSQFIR